MRRMLATAVVTGAVLLGLGACTPSQLEVEQRTTRSAYKVLTGRAATGEVTCALEPVPRAAGVYEGTCTVHRQTFGVQAHYTEDGTSAWVGTATRRSDGHNVVHVCDFTRAGDTWSLSAPCRTDDSL